jgi:very-short-patch-repair endonuclease
MVNYKRNYDWNLIQQYIDKGWSMRDIHRDFGPTFDAIYRANKKGWISLLTSKQSRKNRRDKGITPPPVISEYAKQQISKGMKRAHAEGRAWNIGNSRWNNTPSWPEKWFMTVIENEFEDTNYLREYALDRYSLDFAWPHKKLCIEIDGEQHQRFDAYRARDVQKDATLKKSGWKVLRLQWKDILADSKGKISEAKNFIDTGVI